MRRYSDCSQTTNLIFKKKTERFLLVFNKVHSLVQVSEVLRLCVMICRKTKVHVTHD